MHPDRSLPEIDGQARQVGGSERGRFGYSWADYRHAENVGLKLHEAVVGRGTAIHAQFLHGIAGIEAHGIQQVGNLIRDAFYCGTGHVAGRGSASESEDGPRAKESQCGAPRPTKAGTK